jgi:hypothetical protein
MSLGRELLQGPTGGGVIMSEVPYLERGTPAMGCRACIPAQELIANKDTRRLTSMVPNQTKVISIDFPHVQRILEYVAILVL